MRMKLLCASSKVPLTTRETIGYDRVTQSTHVDVRSSSHSDEGDQSSNIGSRLDLKAREGETKNNRATR